MLSVVPSAMIFDDHDMIDDWNTSLSWVEDIRRQPWWHEHVTGGLVSYWVYQHLGNLSPDEIRNEGMLHQFIGLGDATGALSAWAAEAERLMVVPGGYRFSYFRELGPVRLVVIDSRCARVLTPGERRMVDDEHWEWVVEHADVACEHLVLATSVPVAMPGGLHDVEEWNELVSDGKWGRWFIGLGEKVRRAVDLEDWSAFHRSYVAMMNLVRDVATPGRQPAKDPPHTVTIVSGDVHFSFRSRAVFADRPDRPPAASRVHQIVNSPIRNILSTRERRVIRLGLSRVGELVGRILRRSAGARRDQTRWDVEDGPFFANHMCLARARSARRPDGARTRRAGQRRPADPHRRCTVGALAGAAIRQSSLARHDRPVADLAHRHDVGQALDDGQTASGQGVRGGCPPALDRWDRGGCAHVGDSHTDRVGRCHLDAHDVHGRWRVDDRVRHQLAGDELHVVDDDRRDTAQGEELGDRLASPSNSRRTARYLDDETTRGVGVGHPAASSTTSLPLSLARRGGPSMSARGTIGSISDKPTKAVNSTARVDSGRNSASSSRSKVT